MVSKPKKRQVRKVRSEIPEPPKSAKPLKSVKSLIKRNGDLIEELFRSEAWIEIALPTLQEAIAGVSGRFTNGRYHHGSLTRDLSLSTPFVSGYQKALMDFYNHLHDFILEKNKVDAAKKIEKLESQAPLYNPFLEDQHSDN